MGFCKLSQKWKGASFWNEPIKGEHFQAPESGNNRKVN